MRRTSFLLGLLVAAMVAPLPAHASGEILVQVTGPGYVDVTLPASFLPDPEAAKVESVGKRGTHAGFVAEPIGGDAAHHAFAMASVRWPSGAVTTIRQARRADSKNAGVFVNSTDVVLLAPDQAPQGRWRFHFFGDTTTTIRIPAEGLGRSVTVKPARPAPRATTRITSFAVPYSQGRIPLAVGGRSAVVGAVMVHHDKGADFAELCVAPRGNWCHDAAETRVMPDLSEWWQTSEMLEPPGSLEKGEYDFVYTAGATGGLDAHAIAIVVPTP